MPSAQPPAPAPRSLESGSHETRQVPRYLTRQDLQSHLGISERAVDRLIRVHGLKSGSARRVLIALEDYAAWLVGLRRRSTRDDSPVALPGSGRSILPPIEYAPGLDVRALITYDAGEGQPPSRRMAFVLQERGQAPPTTPEALRRLTRHTEDYVEDLWAYAILDKILTALEVERALDGAARARLRPGDSQDAGHLRTCLEWYRSTRGGVTGAGLSRLAREARGEQREALFQALAHSVADSARHGACAALDYALSPLLDEGALAQRLNRRRPTLKRWRVHGEGPVHMRIGRTVRYSELDVVQWLGGHGGR